MCSSDLPVERIRAFESELFTYLRDMHEPLLRTIRETGVLSAESEESLKKAIVDFKASFSQQQQ